MLSDGRKPGKRVIAAGLAAVVVLASTTVAVFALGRGSTDPLPSGPLSSRPFPTYAEPVRPPAVIPGSAPLGIAIPAINVDSSVEEYTVAMARNSKNPLTGVPCYANERIACVNPPEYNKGYWLKAGEGRIPFGDQPGTDAKGTVYIVGHSSAAGDAVFQNLHNLKVDDPITITTENGKMTYYVQETVILDKSSWSSSPYANEQVPGRLVLGTCYRGDGAEYGASGSSTRNALVVAQARKAVDPGA